MKCRENWRINPEKALIWPQQIYLSFFQVRYQKPHDLNYLDFFEDQIYHFLKLKKKLKSNLKKNRFF